MNWKTIHGEGDNPLLPGTHVIEAYGIAFDPPVNMAEISEVIQQIGAQARIYVSDCIKINKKLRKALPGDNPQLRLLATKVLEQILDAHREKTGETIMILRVNDKKLSKESRNIPNEECETHKKLVAKYCGDEKPMQADDLNCALVITACEDRVLLEESRVKMRTKISLTPNALWEAVRTNVKHAEDSWRPKLIDTLVANGWVLFMNDGKVNLLPYGRGVPAYNKKLHAADHPAWARNPAIKWEV